MDEKYTIDFNRVAEAKVISIYDGDTVKVAIRVKKTRMYDRDLGYHIHVEEGWITLHTAVRLYGINAPEISAEGGTASRDFLRAQLPIGSLITLKTSLNPSDKYGRWLGIIYKETENINDLMVSTGHAVVYGV